MKTLEQLKAELTANELELLTVIVNCYVLEDNRCYEFNQYTPMANSTKGILGSLVKKGLVFDSFEDDTEEEYNYFPTDEVLEAFGKPNFTYTDFSK